MVAKKKDPEATEEEVKTQLQNCIGNSHNAQKRGDGKRKVNLASKFAKADKSTDASASLNCSTDTDGGSKEKDPGATEPVTPTCSQPMPFPNVPDVDAGPNTDILQDASSESESESDDSSTE